MALSAQTARCGGTVASRCRAFAAVALLCAAAGFVAAQEPAGAPIEAEPDAAQDEIIRARIESIFAQLEALQNVSVTVEQGVVTLSGTVANDAQATRAIDLANRLEGSVTVEDDIERTLDVQGNVAPLLEQLTTVLNRWLRAVPLVALAVLVFALIAYAGHRLAKWSTLWNRVAPNGFLAELIGQAVRLVMLVVALIAALSLLGATTLMGTILGGAGVLGLTIGFAVRDTMENYISSIMLSIRQPFRANDHVVINEHEGKVVRLTSRATVLMTLDGNQLRIPNSTVFKAVILNYTRNPERRFEFELGVDANDDPIAAIKTGLDAIGALDAVLTEPAPNAVIKTVGDSNIVICFMAWVDQRVSDFGKVRSLAIRTAKTALEREGFSLPEPLYRVRLADARAASGAQLAGPGMADGDAAPGSAAARGTAADARNVMAGPRGAVGQPDAAGRPDAARADPRLRPADRAAAATDAAIVEPPDELLDTSPDTHLEEMVEQERAQTADADLLDRARPVE